MSMHFAGLRVSYLHKCIDCMFSVTVRGLLHEVCLSFSLFFLFVFAQLVSVLLSSHFSRYRNLRNGENEFASCSLIAGHSVLRIIYTLAGLLYCESKIMPVISTHCHLDKGNPVFEYWIGFQMGRNRTTLLSSVVIRKMVFRWFRGRSVDQFIKYIWR